ncbi:hypothetical protein EAI_09065 [Harpegnathos saltator]|uniref:Uncharacterized protein n=1 Tax=Harpegnathos saltator TaxID=610380 RepID=E2C6I1_HARSA|nr:hypothetical protein EAI_09065 [Harpegnathos saltator]
MKLESTSASTWSSLTGLLQFSICRAFSLASRHFASHYVTRGDRESVLLSGPSEKVRHRVRSQLGSFRFHARIQEESQIEGRRSLPQAERDKLEEAHRALDKRLEGCEAELRGKEDELFLQLEKSLRLEEEVERTKLERDSCMAARERLDQEQQSALRRLHLQLDQNEITRRNLERARLDVVRQANIIREEKDALEKEVSLRAFHLATESENRLAPISQAFCFCLQNQSLKEKLKIERNERGAELRRREEGVAALTRETATLRHAARHLRAVTLHATSCRSRRRCSICLYARRTFAEVDDCRDDFSSEIGDRRSQYFENVSSSTSSGSDKSRKISDSLDCNEADDHERTTTAGASGFNRGSKWTSSFRRLLGRKSKGKSDCSSQTSKTDKPR